jgi:probable blue pigment (indigoidine) exporter
MTELALSSDKVTGAVAGVLFAAIWSGAFIATKFALPATSPLWLAGLRLGLAALILFGFQYRQVVQLFRAVSHAMRWRIVAGALLSQAVYLGATYSALTMLPANLVSIIVSILPLVSIPAGLVLLGEEITLRDIASIGVGVLGVVIVIGDPIAIFSNSTAASWPILLTIGSVFALAIGNAMLKPALTAETAWPVCTLQMAISAGVTLCTAGLVEGPLQFQVTSQDVLGLVYLVLIGSIAGTYAWFKVLRSFSSIGASGFFLLTPIFGILFGFTFLSEHITERHLLGSLLICLGIIGRVGFSGRHSGRPVSQP